MKNLLFSLAFMLISSFAFANQQSEQTQEAQQPIDLSIETVDSADFNYSEVEASSMADYASIGDVSEDSSLGDCDIVIIIIDEYEDGDVDVTIIIIDNDC